MAIYAIGDIQGCYSELCRLLEKINFDPAEDTLWFCGDLVNRGPESLQTLRLVKSMGNSALTVLGNHDLHLLALYHGIKKVRVSRDLRKILNSPDCGELLDWLKSQPLLHYDKEHSAVVVHAGIHPAWGLSKARKLAREVETVLRGEDAAWFFKKMYGNKPTAWSDDLKGAKRLRFITNVFTRMRYFNQRAKARLHGQPHATSLLTHGTCSLVSVGSNDQRRCSRDIWALVDAPGRMLRALLRAGRRLCLGRAPGGVAGRF